MINLIHSIKLRSMLPNTTKINFDRKKAPKGEADVQLTIQADFSDKQEDDAKLCKLTFSANAKAMRDGEDTFVDIEFSVDYLFDIVDEESYSKLSDSDKACLSSNLVYMDYRRKLLAAMSVAGMSTVKLPLSLQDLM